MVQLALPSDRPELVHREYVGVTLYMTEQRLVAGENGIALAQGTRPARQLKRLLIPLGAMCLHVGEPLIGCGKPRE